MNIIDFFANLYIPGKAVMAAIAAFLGIFYIHKQAYIIIGLFFTRKFKKAKNYHKYGVIIPARNEEIVIGIALGYEDDNVTNKFRAEKLSLDEACHFYN